MLGALSLILGQRAETKYFFNQAKKCVIEGQFKLSGAGLQPYFEEFDLDYQQDSILRREISIDGKSRAFINDTPVTLAVMKQIGEKLIDIHSQHATSEVNDPGFQLSVVDTLSNHLPLLTQYRLSFREYKKNLQLLINMQTSADEARSKQDYEQFLFNELESANLQPGEQGTLEIEMEALNHAESIKRGLLNGHVLLDGEETATSY